MDNRRFLVVLLLVGAFVYVISPLLMSLVMGAVFAAMLYPLQHRLEEKNLRPYVAAFILTTCLTFGFLLPSFALVFTGAKLGIDKLGSLDVLRGVPQQDGSGFFEGLVDSLISRPAVKDLFDTIGQYFPIEADDVAETLRNVARTAGLKIGAGLANFLTHVPSIFLSVGVMVVSIFFFVGDAEHLGGFIRKHSVFTAKQTDRLMESFVSMSRSVLLASLASAFAQALVFWLACVVLGTSNATLIGFLVFFASFIPLLGSAPLTLLIALHEFFVVSSGHGIVLLIMAVVCIGLDNVIRPLVLRGSANLHPLLAFVAAFGGLQVLGVAGVFLGPVIAGVFLAMVETLDPA